ncbi:MAG: helix-turn-helix domain-containing protein [Promethearchaeota archaeon]
MPSLKSKKQKERFKLLNTLGAKVAFYRRRLELSQQELEDAAKLASGTVSRVESNLVLPTRGTLFRIANVLRLDKKEVAYLFDINFYNE